MKTGGGGGDEGGLHEGEIRDLHAKIGELTVERDSIVASPQEGVRRVNRSFGLDGPSALQAFRTAVEQFKRDELNQDLARDCAIKAWHLCDHAFKSDRVNSQFRNLKDLQAHVKRVCPELGYLQDICIESKHGEITRYEPQIDEARYHQGDFSRDDFDPDDFDVSRLVVEVPGRTFSFNNVLERAVIFWSKFFEEYRIK